MEKEILVKGNDDVQVEFIKDSPNGFYKKGDVVSMHRIVAQKKIDAGAAKLVKAKPEKE